MTDYLGQVIIDLTRILTPMIMVLGITGNLINIVILSRPSLYKHPCSRYFLVLSVNCLAYASITLTHRLLADGYQIDPATWSTFSCKFVLYITQIFFPMAPYFIVLASFDRFCSSSQSARTRQLSNVRFAQKAIWVIIISFSLFYINTAMVVDLRFEDGLGCYNRGDTVYKQVYVVIQCVLFIMLAPLLMTVFGLLTICNAKQVRHVQNVSSRNRRTERQLLMMLLMQVSSHIILTLPMIIVYSMVVLPTSFRATRLTYFVFSVVFFPYHLSYVTPFFLYFLSAKIYREETIRFFRKICRLVTNRRIVPLSGTSVALPPNTISQQSRKE